MGQSQFALSFALVLGGGCHPVRGPDIRAEDTPPAGREVVVLKGARVIDGTGSPPPGKRYTRHRRGDVALCRTERSRLDSACGSRSRRIGQDHRARAHLRSLAPGVGGRRVCGVAELDTSEHPPAARAIRGARRDHRDVARAQWLCLLRAPARTAPRGAPRRRCIRCRPRNRHSRRGSARRRGVSVRADERRLAMSWTRATASSRKASRRATSSRPRASYRSCHRGDRCRGTHTDSTAVIEHVWLRVDSGRVKRREVND